MIPILLISGFAVVVAVISAAAVAPLERGPAVDARPWPFDNSAYAAAGTEVSWAGTRHDRDQSPPPDLDYRG